MCQNLNGSIKKAGSAKRIHHVALPAFSLLRCFQHILYKYPVPSRRIIHQNVCYGTNQFAVLNDRRPAHADVK